MNPTKIKKSVWDNIYQGQIFKYEYIKNSDLVRINFDLYDINHIFCGEDVSKISLSTTISKSFLRSLDSLENDLVKIYIDPRQIVILQGKNNIYSKNVINVESVFNGAYEPNYPNFIVFEKDGILISVDRPYYSTLDNLGDSIFYYKHNINLIIPETAITLFNST